MCVWTSARDCERGRGTNGPRQVGSKVLSSSFAEAGLKSSYKFPRCRRITILFPGVAVRYAVKRSHSSKKYHPMSSSRSLGRVVGFAGLYMSEGKDTTEQLVRCRSEIGVDA